MQGFDQGPQARSKNGKSAKAHYKGTELCRFHLAGACSRGNACNFAHGVVELKAKPNFEKTRLCSMWVHAGSCKMGSACSFAHSKEEMRQVAAEKRVTADKHRSSVPLSNPQAPGLFNGTNPSISPVYMANSDISPRGFDDLFWPDILPMSLPGDDIAEGSAGSSSELRSACLPYVPGGSNHDGAGMSENGEKSLCSPLYCPMYERQAQDIGCASTASATTTASDAQRFEQSSWGATANVAWL
eukprot:TRINITY_DN10109_c0_g1_i1.p1 TRINITY_DN10109_c0_g1~~TRINITY_DN10109_c0_g1_i1.p1  ORF type:complete len:243 (-),score=38.47 TRINITY_DN10109_c0_g1_i1:82-810(-)